MRQVQLGSTAFTGMICPSFRTGHSEQANFRSLCDLQRSKPWSRGVKTGKSPTTRMILPRRRTGPRLVACSMSLILPWVAANSASGVSIASHLGSVGVSAWAGLKGTAMQALASTTGTWAGLTLWTFTSMIIYALRRSSLHGISLNVVLSRHFINGFDEPKHPHFAVIRIPDSRDEHAYAHDQWSTCALPCVVISFVCFARCPRTSLISCMHT